MLSPKHVDVAGQYLADLDAACETVRNGEAAKKAKVEARYS